LRRAFFHALNRAASRRWSCDAMLWRAIAGGLGLALIGLVMMALAIGAAGSAPPESGLRGDAPLVAQAIPNQRLEIYQDPAEALGWALPVP